MEPDVREIPFAARSGGTGPLTWSQQDMLGVMRALPGRYVHFNMTFSVRLPPGTSLDEVATALRLSTERHEALRTTVSGIASGPAEQLVHRSGTLRLRLHRFAGTPDAAASKAVSRLGRRTPVGCPGDEPYRSDLLLADGRPHTLVLTCNHLILDGFSVPVLCDEVLRRLDGADLPPVPQSPRERARFEQGPGGLAQSARGLRAAERALRAAPDTPLRRTENAGQPPFWWGRMRSPALAGALRLLAERYSVPTSAVLIGIAGTLLAEDREAFAFSLITSNRFSPQLRRSLGCYFQPVPVTVRADRASFAETSRRVAAAAAQAGLNGQFDPAALEKLTDLVESGTGRVLRPLPVLNIQNCTVGPEGLSARETRRLLPRSTYESTGLTGMEDAGLYLNATARDGTLELVLRTDTSRMSPAAGELYLRGIEQGALTLLDSDGPVRFGAGGAALAPVAFVPAPGLQFCSCATHEVAEPVRAEAAS
ncbi:condensation domain-containing protein [Streptomyces sp. NPDC091272]|uniref:condensation domain-containing protein n=1 Tax=Streptomyces sp. NPDC091272 TaxID=3365981 RepID=UPI003812F9B7